MASIDQARACCILQVKPELWRKALPGSSGTASAERALQVHKQAVLPALGTKALHSFKQMRNRNT